MAVPAGIPGGADVAAGEAGGGARPASRRAAQPSTKAKWTVESSAMVKSVSSMPRANRPASARTPTACRNLSVPNQTQTTKPAAVSYRPDRPTDQPPPRSPAAEFSSARPGMGRNSGLGLGYYSPQAAAADQPESAANDGSWGR